MRWLPPFCPPCDKAFLDLSTYTHDLEQLAAVDDIDGYFSAIVLMGGVPLLHPRIADVMRITRNILTNEYIGLCTNGLLLRRMDDAFWNALVDCNVELAISPYPLAIDYDALLKLARSKGVHAFLSNDITGTCEGKEAFLRLALDPDGECNPVQSFSSCPIGGYILQLARGAIWPCQVAAHHGAFAQRFGYDMHDGPEDSLPLDSIDMAGQIEDFRRKSHPMCRYCRNEALTVAPWEQSRFSADEWLAPHSAR